MTDEPIRVLRILSRLNIGGPSIHVVLLTAGLDRERYQTTLIVEREGEREGSFHGLALPPVTEAPGTSPRGGVHGLWSRYWVGKTTR